MPNLLDNFEDYERIIEEHENGNRITLGNNSSPTCLPPARNSSPMPPPTPGRAWKPHIKQTPERKSCGSNVTALLCRKTEKQKRILIEIYATVRYNKRKTERRGHYG